MRAPHKPKEDAIVRDKIKVGSRVKFIYDRDYKQVNPKEIAKAMVEGTVCEIHKDHKWFRVAYMANNNSISTCFSFNDIGNAVKVIKE